ncbi:MAG: putative nucleoside-diphosphate sugar epimerase, partial [Frankiales bacterium]|nr:putative nucleoside-diphosphate sugar epimerase [Frankiales bacterium]
MAVVVVTGASGTLGSRLVPALWDAGHDVRGMTRKGGRVGRGEVVADVLDPRSLPAALDDSDLVVHLASSPRRTAAQTEVEGTRNLLAAAGPAHVLYLSIVGCDRTPFGYYRAKTAAEELVRAAGGTVVRATQFHSLVRTMLAPRLASRAITARGLRLQPVDEDFVAEVLVECVADPPSAPAEIGGPEQLGVDELARRVTGKPPLALPVPIPLVRA